MRPRPAALAGVDGPRGCPAQPARSGGGWAQTAVRRPHAGCNLSLNMRPEFRAHACQHAHTHAHGWDLGGVMWATEPKGPGAAWHAPWSGGVTARSVLLSTRVHRQRPVAVEDTLVASSVQEHAHTCTHAPAHTHMAHVHRRTVHRYTTCAAHVHTSPRVHTCTCIHTCVHTAPACVHARPAHLHVCAGTCTHVCAHTFRVWGGLGVSSKSKLLRRGTKSQTCALDVTPFSCPLLAQRLRMQGSPGDPQGPGVRRRKSSSCRTCSPKATHLVRRSTVL